MKRLIRVLLVLLLTFTCLCLNNKTFAAESTAEIKGYKTVGLKYYSDKSSNMVIKTDSYKYGEVGAWISIYRGLVPQSDGTTVAYYVCFVDAYLQSEGHIGKNYFRNKELMVEVDFASAYSFQLVNYTEGSNDATTSESVTWSGSLGISGEAGTSGINAGATGEIGFSYTKSQTYSTVNCEFNSNNENSHEISTYKFRFTKWKDGKMISPNIGRVNERVSLVYEIANFNGEDNFTLNINVEGTVFKDATWPHKNYTESRSINLESIDGIIL